jgi:biotin transport system substrate-specific component
VRRGADRHVLPAVLLFLAGQLVIFGIGVPWLAVVADLSAGQAVAAGFTPFVVGGLVKAVLAGLLLPAAWRLVGAADGRRD